MISAVIVEGSGTTGISRENTSATAPAIATAATTKNWIRSSSLTCRGRRSIGRPDAARIVPQTGRLSAPATCTRPLAGRITPGVARPWMTSIVAITENAMPIHTARPSFRRAAMTDIAIAEAAARAPATPDHDHVEDRDEHDHDHVGPGQQHRRNHHRTCE